jgi:hypothetical protein
MRETVHRPKQSENMGNVKRFMSAGEGAEALVAIFVVEDRLIHLPA